MQICSALSPGAAEGCSKFQAELAASRTKWLPAKATGGGPKERAGIAHSLASSSPKAGEMVAHVSLSGVLVQLAHKDARPRLRICRPCTQRQQVGVTAVDSGPEGRTLLTNSGGLHMKTEHGHGHGRLSSSHIH